jgi:NADPH:quinone reductase-like Zn-dependent oxidoreductase
MLLKHAISLNFLFTDPTMEAVQFDPKNKELSLIKTPLPSEPNKYEVVIRVAYSGICGTDLHITEVHNPLKGNCFSPESGVLFIIFSTIWILNKHS